MRRQVSFSALRVGWSSEKDREGWKSTRERERAEGEGGSYHYHKAT